MLHFKELRGLLQLQGFQLIQHGHWDRFSEERIKDLYWIRVNDMHFLEKCTFQNSVFDIQSGFYDVKDSVVPLVLERAYSLAQLNLSLVLSAHSLLKAPESSGKDVVFLTFMHRRSGREIMILSTGIPSTSASNSRKMRQVCVWQPLGPTMGTVATPETRHPRLPWRNVWTRKSSGASTAPAGQGGCSWRVRGCRCEVWFVVYVLTCAVWI